MTFATPFVRFCFKLLPYGIISASEIFQADISEIIEGLEGARNSQDDIIVSAEILVEHNNRVSKVMTKIRESGLKLNNSKYVFGVQIITFLGHKLSSTGISLEPPKSQSDLWNAKTYIQNRPTTFPRTGSLPFEIYINILDKTKELRELILKETDWDFSELHKRKFDELKSTISNCANFSIRNYKL